MNTQTVPSITERKIASALDRRTQTTEYYAAVGGCSLGEAVEILNRLKGRGQAQIGPPGYGGMTWRAAR